MPVTLHVWRVPPRRVPAAMVRLGLVRRPSGVRFAKFLGTGTGISFGPGDADLTRYAAVTVSEREVRFPAWDRAAVLSARVELEPLTSRGRWSGVEPFGPEPVAGGDRDRVERFGNVRKRPPGMVLALTRARLKPAKALTFWRAVPPVAAELAAAPGLLARFGVGEAPIGWQGTVSVWRDATDLTRFAYRQPEHRAVITRTPVDRWYAEELFARFAVLGIEGDRTVLGWLEGGQAKR
jgi:hypothetical protein